MGRPLPYVRETIALAGRGERQPLLGILAAVTPVKVPSSWVSTLLAACTVLVVGCQRGQPLPTSLEPDAAAIVAQLVGEDRPIDNRYRIDLVQRYSYPAEALHDWSRQKAEPVRWAVDVQALRGRAPTSPGRRHVARIHCPVIEGDRAEVYYSLDYPSGGAEYLYVFERVDDGWEYRDCLFLSIGCSDM